MIVYECVYCHVDLKVTIEIDHEEIGKGWYSASVWYKPKKNESIVNCYCSECGLLYKADLCSPPTRY